MSDADTPVPRAPTSMTTAGHRYAVDQLELSSFVAFIVDLATDIDEVVKKTHTALAILRKPLGRHDSEEDKERAQKGLGATERLRSHLQLFMQMMICRSVDNFLTYIAELLAGIFRARPETLRSNETVLLDEVLQHQSMDELIAALADRKVHRLSYKGMDELAQHFSARLGLDIFTNKDELKKAIKLIECRNLIVHNRAVVNKLFLSRVRGTGRWKMGDVLDFDVEEIIDSLTFLSDVVRELDDRAADKFDLPRPCSAELPFSNDGEK